MHEFRLEQSLAVTATPEQVWEAIATGPGIDSWFMGRNQVTAGVGGETSMTLLGHTQRSTITGWEPTTRFAHNSEPGDDGTFMAFEYLIEGRNDGSTVLRLVQSGVLGDNWDTEYEAMKAGWPMYLDTLAAYLTHFGGRAATLITAVAPQAGDAHQVWDRIRRRLELPDQIIPGVPARITVGVGSPIVGAVDCVHLPHYLGVRSSDGLYRFVHSGPARGNTLVIGHHLFAVADRDVAEADWAAWINQVAAE